MQPLYIRIPVQCASIEETACVLFVYQMWRQNSFLLKALCWGPGAGAATCSGSGGRRTRRGWRSPSRCGRPFCAGWMVLGRQDFNWAATLCFYDPNASLLPPRPATLVTHHHSVVCFHNASLQSLERLPKEGYTNHKLTSNFTHSRFRTAWLCPRGPGPELLARAIFGRWLMPLMRPGC